MRTVLPCLIALSGFFLAGSLGYAEDTPRPNILFIQADDLGWTDLACQGSEYYETPNIDRLAAQGIRFTRFYVSPNCAPSRAALLSGQYAPRTGVYTVGDTVRGNTADRTLNVPANLRDLPLDRKTLGDVAKSAGYATGIFGKWHVGVDGDYHPAKRGFDEAITSQGKHYGFVTKPPVDHPADEYYTDFVTARGVDFISRHKADPFFLYIPYFAVHSPIDPKPEYAARWKDKSAKGTHWNSKYAAMIQSLDEGVGKLLDALDANGVAGKTLVIFTSDNGGVGGYARTEPPGERPVSTSNEPLRGGKGTLYEGGVRVPFIVRWPGVAPAGTTCTAPIAHVDFLPTLAALLNVPLPDQPIDGVSLLALFRDPAATLPARNLYLHFPGYLESYVRETGWRTTPAAYVIAGDWKLIHFFEDNRAELYNVVEDPGEHKDMAALHPGKAQELGNALAQWQRDIHAAMPTPKQ